MKEHHEKYECVADGCRAGSWGIDDFPPAVVLNLCRPGWHWDGERMWCPKHATEAANVPAPESR